MNEYIQAILSLFWVNLLFCTVLSLCLAYILEKLLKRIAKFFSVPRRIKTHDGWLYRSLSGVYVPKAELEYNDVGYIFKNKQRGIKHLERRLELLRKSSDEIKESHKHYFDETT